MTQLLLRRLPPSATVGCLLLVLTAASSSNAQQTTEPTFVFDTGQPAWRGERIELPPGFARDLGWNGVEQIRFAPGMFKAEADDFFSYVLVFLLEPGSDVSETGLTRELLTYFKGLSTAVMKGKKQTVDTTAFSFTIDKADQVESAPASAKGVTAYTGILDWVEPFATQKKQLLNFEVHTWEHNGQAVVLSCVSPLERDQALWTELREIRSKFHFEP